MSTQWNRVPWEPYIISFILVQTSILGLGIVSIALSLISYLLLRGRSKQITDYYTAKLFRWGLRSLLYAAVLHIFSYGIFLVKVLVSETGSDLAFAFFSHAMIHHFLSTGIALFLVLRVVKGLFAMPINDPDQTEAMAKI
ncbi:MAG: hypothetical protein V7731_08635 [Amphritea sp.]